MSSTSRPPARIPSEVVRRARREGRTESSIGFYSLGLKFGELGLFDSERYFESYYEGVRTRMLSQPLKPGSGFGPVFLAINSETSRNISMQSERILRMTGYVIDVERGRAVASPTQVAHRSLRDSTKWIAQTGHRFSPFIARHDSIVELRGMSSHNLLLPAVRDDLYLIEMEKQLQLLDQVRQDTNTISLVDHIDGFTSFPIVEEGRG